MGAGEEQRGGEDRPYPVADTCTFMGVPRVDHPSGTGPVVLGIPFGCDTHPFRVGYRYGPHAIRELSNLLRPYQPPHADFDPLARLEVVDCGNVDVTPGDIAKSFPAIEQAVGRIAGNGAIPMTMGDDDSVTLPQLRALHGVYPDLAVLHLDAHTDTGPGAEPGEIGTSTTFTRAAEEGLVDLEHSIHLGADGDTFTGSDLGHRRPGGLPAQLYPGRRHGQPHGRGQRSDRRRDSRARLRRHIQWQHLPEGNAEKG